VWLVNRELEQTMSRCPALAPSHASREAGLGGPEFR
jgi:hypothetical protein